MVVHWRSQLKQEFNVINNWSWLAAAGNLLRILSFLGEGEMRENCGAILEARVSYLG